jgi:hypothetical protein
VIGAADPDRAVRHAVRADPAPALGAGYVCLAIRMSVAAEGFGHAHPAPVPAPAGRSPAPPVPDAARGRMVRTRRLSVPLALSCAPRARLPCERRPKNEQMPRRDERIAG